MLRVFRGDVSSLPEDCAGFRLSEYRREKLEKTVPAEARRQSLGAELLLIRALQSVCPQEPVPPQIYRGRNGKPYLTSGAVFFSLSHSGTQAACAVADSELGIDLQSAEKYSPTLAERFFAPDEREYLKSLGSEADFEFTRLWTLKESYIKAVGGSLSLLPSFSVLSEAGTGDRRFFHTVFDGCHFALCSRDCPESLNIETVKLL